MTHTETPWEVVELGSPATPFGSFVIRAKKAPGGIAVTVGGLGEEERANAHLIKAAPSLLAAVKLARDMWDSNEDTKRARDRRAAAWKAMNAAIAEAETL